MTLDKLKQDHPDIILDEIPWDELRPIAAGAAIFYASLSGGTKPAGCRKVLYAGQAMTVSLKDNRELYVLRLTASGYAKLDVVQRTAVEQDRRAVLFRTRPMRAGDPRARKPWTEWRPGSQPAGAGPRNGGAE